MVKYHKDIVKEASHFYAKAKYEGHLDQVTNEIQAILDGIQNTSTFRQLMHLEHVSYDKKLAVLESTFGHLSSETQEYLATFPSEDGSMNIVEALEAFLELYNANKLEIVSAIPLTDEQIERIAIAFQNKTEKEYDSWVNTVDPSIIGGVQLKTKEFLLDGTISNKLKQFKEKVSQTGLKR